jgi:hypothetical protein
MGKTGGEKEGRGEMGKEGVRRVLECFIRSMHTFLNLTAQSSVLCILGHFSDQGEGGGGGLVHQLFILGTLFRPNLVCILVYLCYH